MTDTERQLWFRLRGKQLGDVQFYRQKTLGNYIVDFYAPKAGLVIEIDGEQHGEKDYREKDRKRDEWLHCRGLQILRVSNREVLQEMEGVLETILKTVEERKRL